MSYYPPGVSGDEPYLTGEPEPEECSTCGGDGTLPDGSECMDCEGSGSITPESPEPEWEPPEERG